MKPFLLLSLGVLLLSCSKKDNPSYNDGINIIPVPNQMTISSESQRFKLKNNMKVWTMSDESEAIAKYMTDIVSQSTGYTFEHTRVESAFEEADIRLNIDVAIDLKDEGYELIVTPDAIEINGMDEAGLFYGVQSLLQLLPAEITSFEKVEGIEWSAPCVEITDEPRLPYRGIMLDACRHFMPVEFIKAQLDILAMFKINTMHWHLTEDQAWRVEIKKYPKLTELGSYRKEPDGTVIEGYYTQEQIRDIVKYAAERHITIIPEFDLPGHGLAAITGYPELSCNNDKVSPRIIWGVEDIVMCPGKENTMTFIEDVIDELVELFPGEYFHVGGDECPKRVWAKCPKCQELIKREGLMAEDGHSKEERLQSYVIKRVEKMLDKHNRKLIGWDEILEGGLSENATVMAWRNQENGIEAAKMGNNVIMSPNPHGFYLDHYQGDFRIEPVSIGGYAPLSKTYNYNPVAEELTDLGIENRIIGIQGNVWTEYMHTTDLMEYRMYPRTLAVAEVGWSQMNVKNFDDFARRINNAYVRLDNYGVDYHIPQPEQPNGSVNNVAFIDSCKIEFTNTRNIDMVYTVDGTDPTPSSTRYTSPLVFKQDAVVKIATLLPSHKMSPVRTITAKKQTPLPAIEKGDLESGLTMKSKEGLYFNHKEYFASEVDITVEKINNLSEIVDATGFETPSSAMRQRGNYASGYISIPEDGIYYFRTNHDLWIGGRQIIDNTGEVRRFSRKGNTIALSKGLHQIDVLFLGNIVRGWPSNWDAEGIVIRNMNAKDEKQISPEQLFRATDKQ